MPFNDIIQQYSIDVDLILISMLTIGSIAKKTFFQRNAAHDYWLSILRNKHNFIYFLHQHDLRCRHKVDGCFILSETASFEQIFADFL